MDYANQRRFTAMCRRIRIADEKSDEIFADLKARYLEVHRSYHNLTHIDRMLSWVDASGSGSDTVELAIWFHDAIYEPLAGDNEEKSAQYFAKCLGSITDKAMLSDVERLIMATDFTSARSGAPDEDLIIDIDLSILGSAPEDYEVYRHAVRREYTCVAEAAFTAGRASILQGFLSKKIYATEFFSALEGQARSNIKLEIKNLESGS